MRPSLSRTVRPLAPQTRSHMAVRRWRELMVCLAILPVESERVPAGEDPEFHLKLGPGSLSHVEWTIQILHLRSGVRAERTLAAVDVLAEGAALNAGDTQVLAEAYRFCEEARNRLYLVRGRPGDSLTPPGHHLATLMGAQDVGFHQRASLQCEGSCALFGEHIGSCLTVAHTSDLHGQRSVLGWHGGRLPYESEIASCGYLIGLSRSARTRGVLYGAPRRRGALALGAQRRAASARRSPRHAASRHLPIADMAGARSDASRSDRRRRSRPFRGASARTGSNAREVPAGSSLAGATRSGRTSLLHHDCHPAGIAVPRR